MIQMMNDQSARLIRLLIPSNPRLIWGHPPCLTFVLSFWHVCIIEHVVLEAGAASKIFSSWLAFFSRTGNILINIAEVKMFPRHEWGCEKLLQVWRVTPLGGTDSYLSEFVLKGLLSFPLSFTCDHLETKQLFMPKQPPTALSSAATYHGDVHVHLTVVQPSKATKCQARPSPFLSIRRMAFFSLMITQTEMYMLAKISALGVFKAKHLSVLCTFVLFFSVSLFALFCVCVQNVSPLTKQHVSMALGPRD